MLALLPQMLKGFLAKKYASFSVGEMEINTFFKLKTLAFSQNKKKLTPPPKVWTCGGQLLMVTCSHVGHVFRRGGAYKFPGGILRIIHRNNGRLAEVWLDEWKEFYFRYSRGEWRG